MKYNFSERLHIALKRANKKPVDLAQATGLSQALISQYLNEKQTAKNDKISLIAECLNVSESWLAGFTDDIGHFGIEENKNFYGNHKDNLDYFSDKPELLDLYQQIYESEKLQLLFDSAKDLTPHDLEIVLSVIDRFRKEKGIE